MRLPHSTAEASTRSGFLKLKLFKNNKSRSAHVFLHAGLAVRSTRATPAAHRTILTGGGGASSPMNKALTFHQEPRARQCDQLPQDSARVVRVHVNLHRERVKMLAREPLKQAPSKSGARVQDPGAGR